jgi:hypothetical protein
MEIRSRLHTAVATFSLNNGRVIVIAFYVIANRIVNLSVRAEEICIFLRIASDFLSGVGLKRIHMLIAGNLMNVG